jgi:hypothetical protein
MHFYNLTSYRYHGSGGSGLLETKDYHTVENESNEALVRYIWIHLPRSESTEITNRGVYKKESRNSACAKTFARSDVVFDTLNSFPEEPGRSLDCRRSRTEHEIANLIPIAGLYRKFVLVDDLQSTAPRLFTLLDVQYRTQSSGSKT